MVRTFELGGDPAAIRESAARWGAFAGKASGASSRIARMDASEFVGTEGDMYRQALHADMRPHLDRTAEAWTTVHGALHAYAATLERLQQRMAAVAATANAQRATLDRAQSSLADSRRADLRHQRMELAVAGTSVTLMPAPPAPAADSYTSHTPQYTSAVSDAQHALQQTINAANTIHGEHEAALDLCCDLIHAAKMMRFVRPPGWFSRALHAVGHWVAEHAGQLLKISSILKTISGIAGILALIPVLSPIMGPIAFLTGAAAFGIDLAVDAGTGHWNNWRSLVLEGVSLIPGSRALMEMRTVQRMGSLGRAAETMAKSETLWKAADGIQQATNIAISGYDLGEKISKGKAGWEDYLSAATSVASVRVGAPRAVRQSLHLGDRAFRKINAIKDVAVSSVSAAPALYNLGVKIKEGKAGVDDYLGAAEGVAGVAGSTATVTKYRAPGDTGTYHAGTQMHHRAWETPSYTGADTAKAFKNAFHQARVHAGLHVAAAALVVALHSGPTSGPTLG